MLATQGIQRTDLIDWEDGHCLPWIYSLCSRPPRFDCRNSCWWKDLEAVEALGVSGLIPLQRFQFAQLVACR